MTRKEIELMLKQDSLVEADIAMLVENMNLLTDKEKINLGFMEEVEEEVKKKK